MHGYLLFVVYIFGSVSIELNKNPKLNIFWNLACITIPVNTSPKNIYSSEPNLLNYLYLLLFSLSNGFLYIEYILSPFKETYVLWIEMKPFSRYFNGTIKYTRKEYCGLFKQSHVSFERLSTLKHTKKYHLISSISRN